MSGNVEGSGYIGLATTRRASTVRQEPRSYLLQETPALGRATHHPIPTFRPRHHQPGVREVFLVVLRRVHVGAPALHLPPVEADGGVDGDGVGPLGLLRRALALDLATHGIPRSRAQLR